MTEQKFFNLKIVLKYSDGHKTKYYRTSANVQNVEQVKAKFEKVFSRLNLHSQRLTVEISNADSSKVVKYTAGKSWLFDIKYAGAEYLLNEMIFKIELFIAHN